MPVVVSMLRGVNLGPHNRIKMDALRALYESLGLRDVQSYVQSGNILYRTSKRDLEAVARQVEEAMLERHGIRTAIVQRSCEDLRGVVERNPFAGREGIDPARLGVTFLREDPGQAARDQAAALAVGPEEMHLTGREMYVYYVNGFARTKFPGVAIEKTLKTTGTTRNWNSVTKLLELSEAAATRR